MQSIVDAPKHEMRINLLRIHPISSYDKVLDGFGRPNAARHGRIVEHQITSMTHVRFDGFIGKFDGRENVAIDMCQRDAMGFLKYGSGGFLEKSFHELN